MIRKLLTSAIIFPIVCFMSFYLTYSFISSNEFINKTVIDSALDTDTTRVAFVQVLNNSYDPNLKDHLGIFKNEYIPANSKKYLILSSSKISFIAKRDILHKETEEIFGSTDIVVGGGWIDFEGQDMFFKADIDLSTFKSDDAERDKSMWLLFINKIAEIEVTGKVDEDYVITMGTPFQTEFESKITVNDISVEKVILTDGNISNGKFDLTGNFVLKMSDHNITPPSMSGIFQFEDEVVINFNIKGTNYD